MPAPEASGSEADGEEDGNGDAQVHASPKRQGSDVSEDITQKEDVRPDSRVTAFWETTGEH